MTIPAFDTLAFVKKLIASGIPEKQAEAHAEIQAQILSELVTEKLATKDDLFKLEEHLKQEFIKLEAKVDNLDTKFTGKFNHLYWMFGFIVTGLAGILIKLYS